MKMAQLNKRESEIFLRAISFQLQPLLLSCLLLFTSDSGVHLLHPNPRTPGVRGEGTSAFLSSFPSLPQTLGTAKVPERISPQGIWGLCGCSGKSTSFTVPSSHFQSLPRWTQWWSRCPGCWVPGCQTRQELVPFLHCSPSSTWRRCTSPMWASLCSTSRKSLPTWLRACLGLQITPDMSETCQAGRCQSTVDVL